MILQKSNEQHQNGFQKVHEQANNEHLSENEPDNQKKHSSRKVKQEERIQRLYGDFLDNL